MVRKEWFWAPPHGLVVRTRSLALRTSLLVFSASFWDSLSWSFTSSLEKGNVHGLLFAILEISYTCPLFPGPKKSYGNSMWEGGVKRHGFLMNVWSETEFPEWSLWGWNKINVNMYLLLEQHVLLVIESTFIYTFIEWT